MNAVGNNRRSSRFVKGTNIEKPANLDGAGLCAMFLHPLCILLVCLPLGALSQHFHWGPSYTFWLNFFAMVPLAKILGDATEELAAGLKNDMLAGLLNATFGNAVEVVLMVQTLRRGLIDVVKATMLGSVLSNLLLVLGCSFFFGGMLSGTDEPRRSSLRRSTASSAIAFVGEKVQTYSVLTAMVNTSLLLLSCLTLSLVTVFNAEGDFDNDDAQIAVVLSISRTCAIAMMLSYGAYIFFQLVTHRDAMSEDENGEDQDDAAVSIPGALAIMCITTILVAISTESLLESLDTVVVDMKISKHFIGIILLPIVGNACEHVSAVRFAIMDKPGLSIGIAVGSSTQIALFVVPFSVLAGWAIGQPMELDFGLLNTTVLFVSVVVVLSIVVDGSATWLQGYLLLSAYFVVAVLYLHVPDRVKEAIL